jgi:hypothetical protein
MYQVIVATDLNDNSIDKLFIEKKNAAALYELACTASDAIGAVILDAETGEILEMWNHKDGVIILNGVDIVNKIANDDEDLFGFFIDEDGNRIEF